MLKSFRTGCVFFFYARSHGQLQYHLCVRETRVAANDSWRQPGKIADDAIRADPELETAPRGRLLCLEQPATIDT